MVDRHYRLIVSLIGEVNITTCFSCTFTETISFINDTEGFPYHIAANLRNPVNNIDGWTSSLSGCRCAFDPLRTDCACCQSYGCQCGGGNKNQCVNCGHPEHCGLKEHIFGPNPYCRPNTCPRKINTIWEGEAPHGFNSGSHSGIIKEVAASVVQAVKKAIRPA